MHRRELSDMLTDVAQAVLAGAGTPAVRTTSMELALPVDVAMESRHGELVLLAELPRFVYRTSFDLPPSRLRVMWVERDAP
jgi:hypothetical protein